MNRTDISNDWKHVKEHSEVLLWVWSETVRIGCINKFIKKECPFLDYAGNTMKEGDIIEHPDGTTAKIVYVKDWVRDEEIHKWRVDYGDGNLDCPLFLQVNDRGRAIKMSDQLKQHRLLKTSDLESFLRDNEQLFASEVVVFNKSNGVLTLFVSFTNPRFRISLNFQSIYTNDSSEAIHVFNNYNQHFSKEDTHFQKKL